VTYTLLGRFPLSSPVVAVGRMINEGISMSGSLKSGAFRHFFGNVMIQLEKLFRLVAESKASDLLIVANAPPYLRVDGELQPVGKEVLTTDMTHKLIYDLLTDEQKKQFEQEKSVDVGFCYWSETDDWVHRFRINVFQQQGSVSAAFRSISNKVPDFDELRLPNMLKEIAQHSQGLVIVTGPTGHGKSTTLASLVDLINNTKAFHIITVEDPIEYIHDHKKSLVEQREIGRDTPSFYAALRYVLRQDPDVILVGEMRDRETISCVITAAETGHLVMATLHTNDAIQTIDRLIDAFPPEQQHQVRLQISLCLTAVVAQRLIPRIDGGRVVACEILINNVAVANLIRDGKTHQIYNVLETRTQEGMISMDQALETLYREGLISREHAMAYMKKPEKLFR